MNKRPDEGLAPADQEAARIWESMIAGDARSETAQLGSVCRPANPRQIATRSVERQSGGGRHVWQGG
jgi:hypothetical protein